MHINNNKVRLETVDIVVDSRDRNISKYPDSSLYLLHLGNTNQIKDVVSMEILGMDFPQSQYVIDKHNNKITYSIDGGLNINKSITPGDYNSLGELISELSDKLPTNYLNINIDENKKELSITKDFSTPSSLISYDIECYNILGIPRNGIIGQSSIYAQYPIRRIKEPYIYININDYDRMKTTRNKFNDPYAKYYFNKEKNNVRQVMMFNPIKEKLYKLQIHITNYNNTLYQSNGTDHSFILRIKRIIGK